MLKRFTERKEKLPAIRPRPPAPMELLIGGWLQAKRRRSGSAKTEQVYRAIITHFRNDLLKIGLDLDSDEGLVMLAAQGWSSQPWPVDNPKRAYKLPEVGRATINQRLAVLSSFYTYAMRQPGGLKSNPILKVERTKVRPYSSAKALDPLKVRDDLAAISRETLDGQRDYCLLTIALTTGRRVGEMAALVWRDVERQRDGSVILQFPHAKGGKHLSDLLAVAISRALLAYLGALYADLNTLRPDAPLWPDMARNSRGTALTVHSLERISLRWLGTSIFHRTRHTFAHQMQKAGAAETEIKARMAQESLDTLHIYLAELGRAENPYAERLADIYGVK